MTDLDDNIATLEHLRDNHLVNNADGKSKLNDVIARLKKQPILTEDKATVVAKQDRRTEERDPMETEQHQAEKLGIAPEPEPEKETHWYSKK